MSAPSLCYFCISGHSSFLHCYCFLAKALRRCCWNSHLGAGMMTESGTSMQITASVPYSQEVRGRWYCYCTAVLALQRLEARSLDFIVCDTFRLFWHHGCIVFSLSLFFFCNCLLVWGYSVFLKQQFEKFVLGGLDLLLCFCLQNYSFLLLPLYWYCTYLCYTWPVRFWRGCSTAVHIKTGENVCLPNSYCVAKLG